MRIIIAALMLSLVAGCATYDDASRFGGYTHTRVKENLYTVTYEGNMFTTFGEAHELAMRRAKEIGRELGYKYMYIMGTSEGSLDSTVGIRNGSYILETVGLANPKYSLRVKYLFNHPKDKYLKDDIHPL